MLVSAIIPTRGRPHFAHRALDCALRQTGGDYGLEIHILDDLDSPSFFNAPDFNGVHYHISEKRLNIGEKRNRLCELASGDIIVHFDDDDYSAPGRITDQVDRLMSTGAALTGYNEMLFQTHGACIGKDPDCWLHYGDATYAIGTSMMYRRDFWKRNPFKSIPVGEDTLFLGTARREGVACVPAGAMMLARIHDGNTHTKKPVAGHGWKRIERQAA